MSERTSILVWHYPTLDPQTGRIEEAPMDYEGEQVLVETVYGEFFVDTVCLGEVIDDLQEVWLDTVQDWSKVLRWAHLPKAEGEA